MHCAIPQKLQKVFNDNNNIIANMYEWAAKLYGFAQKLVMNHKRLVNQWIKFGLNVSYGSCIVIALYIMSYILQFNLSYIYLWVHKISQRLKVNFSGRGEGTHLKPPLPVLLLSLIVLFLNWMIRNKSKLEKVKSK